MEGVIEPVARIAAHGPRGAQEKPGRENFAVVEQDAGAGDAFGEGRLGGHTRDRHARLQNVRPCRRPTHSGVMVAAGEEAAEAKGLGERLLVAVRCLGEFAVQVEVRGGNPETEAVFAIRDRGAEFLAGARCPTA